jgi:hypothetical protein
MTGPDDTAGRVVATAKAKVRCRVTTRRNADRKLPPSKRRVASVEPLWPLPRSSITTSRAFHRVVCSAYGRTAATGGCDETNQSLYEELPCRLSRWTPGTSFRDKIDWEGGAWDALNWGLAAEDLPEQYRDDWRSLAKLYDELDERAAEFYACLPPESDSEAEHEPRSPAASP